MVNQGNYVNYSSELKKKKPQLHDIIRSGLSKRFAVTCRYKICLFSETFNLFWVNFLRLPNSSPFKSIQLTSWATF